MRFYGSLRPTGIHTEIGLMTAASAAYSASKAASDHLSRLWGETYGLPNC